VAVSIHLQTLRYARKLILCGLESSNIALARDAFDELPEAARSDPLTRFLMYKVALKDRDLTLGTYAYQNNNVFFPLYSKPV
jgi:hypothetical protein